MSANDPATKKSIVDKAPEQSDYCYRDIMDAAEVAESRTVNDLPDAHMIAEHMPGWTANTINKHLRKMEDLGVIARHTSVTVESSGVVETVEVTL